MAVSLFFYASCSDVFLSSEGVASEYGNREIRSWREARFAGPIRAGWGITFGLSVNRELR